jgi:cytochrome c
MRRSRHRYRLLLVMTLCALAPLSRAQTAALTDAKAKEFFNARGCNACHAVDEIRIGPPYRAVAIRYPKASPATIDWLATKIIVGGAGSWGTVPMISNPALSPEETRAVARWILDLGRAPPAR